MPLAGPANVRWRPRKGPAPLTFAPAKGALVAAGAAPTVSVSGSGIIDAARRIDWTAAGVPGGITLRSTVFADVKVDYGAVGNGVTDDTAAIQSAIDDCPAGQVVYIPAGTYRLNSLLSITKGITLRGAGPAATLLKTYASWHGIQLGDWPSTPVDTSVSGSPAKGAATLTVGSVTTPSLSVGDYIVIDQVNDGVEVVNVDDESRDGGTRSLSQITKIAQINGLVLTIDPPLYHGYVAAQTPQVWKLNQGNIMTVSAGIEDLYLERVSPTGTEGYSNFKLVACAYCWIKNVHSKLAQFRHVDFDRSFRCEVRDSYFNDGQHHDTGGFAYGVVSAGRATANLVENNIFYHLRHSMVVKEGAAGNVYAYNYSVASWQGEDWLAADLNAHGAHSHMNLFEGNIGAKIYSDYTHGSSSYNTFFRNNPIRDSSAQTITNARRAVDVEQNQYYHNFVGNVLGQTGQVWDAFEDNGTRVPGAGRYVYTWGYFSDGTSTSADAQSKATALRHGNYDYQSASTKWDAGISDHTLPDSLYLSAKPAFFGSTAWPAIGSDLTPMVSDIPAKSAYALGEMPDYLTRSRTISVGVGHVTIAGGNVSIPGPVSIAVPVGAAVYAGRTPSLSAGGGDVHDVASPYGATQVNAAISAASNGDTVRMPSNQSVAWTASVSLPSTKYITFDLNGSTVTLNNGAPFSIDSHASGLNRITNGTIIRGAGYDQYSGQFQINDTPTGYGVRVDHVTFKSNQSYVIVEIAGIGRGVMDHCSFPDLTSAEEFIHVSAWGPNNRTGWTTDVVQANVFTFEDNTFQCDDDQYVAWIQCYYGARVCFRYNTFDNVGVDVHGAAGGGRWWEVYENTSTNTAGNPNMNWLCSFRAGSGLIWNNHESGGSGNIGLCEEDSGYPAEDQIGRGTNQVLDPAFVWNNDGEVALNQCDAPEQPGMVAANRDVYLRAPQAGDALFTLHADLSYPYTPYTYPHPLTT